MRVSPIAAEEKKKIAIRPGYPFIRGDWPVLELLSSLRSEGMEGGCVPIPTLASLGPPFPRGYTLAAKVELPQ